MEIFADVLFVINFSMDFLALFLTGKILSMPVRGKRLAAASAGLSRSEPPCALSLITDGFSERFLCSSRRTSLSEGS